MADNALAPIEQKQVVFYDDEITAVLVDNEEGQNVYVSIRQVTGKRSAKVTLAKLKNH